MNISDLRQHVIHTTFGAEVEYNCDQNPRLWYAMNETDYGDGGRANFLLHNGAENYKIKEIGVKPSHLLRFIRRMAIITELYDMPWQHEEGSSDARAGSCHFHFKNGLTRSSRPMSHFVPLLAFARHFARTKKGSWRCATSYRAKVNTMPSQDPWESLQIDELPYNTKTYWCCYNSGPETIEVRLNENHAPYVPAVIAPVIDFLTGLGIIFGTAAKLPRYLQNSCGKPYLAPRLEATVREDLGNEFDTIKDALFEAYREPIEFLPGSPLQNALPLKIVEAALDGATPQEIHDLVVMPILCKSRWFNQTMERVMDESDHASWVRDRADFLPGSQSEETEERAAA